MTGMPRIEIEFEFDLVFWFGIHLAPYPVFFFFFHLNLLSTHCKPVPAPIAQLVECPLRGTGGHGFDPGPRHTKVVNNGTSCSSLGTQTYGVELGLVDPVSG